MLCPARETAPEWTQSWVEFLSVGGDHDRQRTALRRAGGEKRSDRQRRGERQHDEHHERVIAVGAQLRR